MKYLFVLIAIFVVVVSSEDAQEKESIADKIKKMIEDLRDNNKDKYNNYEFEDSSLQLNDANLGINVDIKASGYLKGLLSFEVTKLSGLFSLTFELVWPGQIELNIHPYDLQGFIDLIRIYGNGDLKLAIENLKVGGKIGLKLNVGTPATFSIKSFALKDLIFEKPQCHLTGWLNDDVRSEVIAKMITDHILDVLAVYDTQVKTAVNDLVMKLTADIKLPFPS